MVRSRVPPSLNVPITESCWLVLAAIVTLPGRMVIDARSAALTLAEAAPLIEPETALIVTAPRLRAVAKPLTVIDATLVFDELQVTVPVIFCVVPSENVPVAVNSCNVPSGSDALAGETAIEVKVALVMVSVALEETAPKVAVMVATPGAIPIASPRAPFTLIVAAETLAEAHCTDRVKFCVLPSVNVPVAVNWTVVPCAMDAVMGVTAMEFRAALATVKVALAETLPDVAVIIDVPRATPFANAGVPFMLMAATAGLADVHCADAVKS